MRRLCLLVCLLLPLTTLASGPAASLSDQRVMAVPGFLDSHPDLRFRKWAVDALHRHEVSTAMDYFRRSARFADKPSQGYLAEMYWHGVEMPADRALAHAWMTVAAERGYPMFVEMRERFAAGLSAEQRQRSQRIQAELFAEYGDEVAKPRIAEVLRRAKLELTGSRTGSQVSNMDIQYESGGMARTIKGSEYYAPKYWDPVEYHRWQDATWEKVPVGTVDVGLPQNLPASSLEPVLPQTQPPVPPTNP
ncbi:hypothetical protein ABB30_01390 [Stenotrophomonas ginsengisoli]|uniref:Sel1 repeat-containing protein n=1 Tax=Stenotrophomonas ginsengisoli TaxID=336566 RepID=A0A0R0DAK8_9GAMM|nr:sel1 repeat family protein [Stenotrophomonas ginsengisoli]KRG79311.1 hypothetical protein ABB30_01390 [Stenotrophomonas ginsengisoli]